MLNYRAQGFSNKFSILGMQCHVWNVKSKSLFCQDVDLVIEYVYDQFFALIELQPYENYGIGSDFSKKYSVSI